MKVKVLGKEYNFKVDEKDPTAKAKIIETIAKSIRFEDEPAPEVDKILQIFRRAGVRW